jgi:glycerol-3-phosphate O-acyltransferase / dihydroxyacetone phosphate acyltransferase
MWLLPAFPALSRMALGTFYRLRFDGVAVPVRGPVLLVANHPNSLLDPALVSAAARRPVRFLAKAPLFSDPVIGWLIRGAGAIPVHRKQDDPTQMARNADAFEAAHAALAGGDAVGIFPEGVSHDEPSLAPLRTGAARIALGAARLHGSDFPIVPVGLVFREKGVFRSEARIVAGATVSWSELAPAGETADAVRDLTARIDAALRAVTLNLERWEDAPLVETAEAIWAAERGGAAGDAEQLRRLEAGTRRLAELRRSGGGDWDPLARRIVHHGRLLERLGLTPAQLHGDPGVLDAAAWALRRFPVANAFALAAGVAGAVLFWPPYRVTGLVARRLNPEPSVLSTTKLLVGIPTYLLWVVLLALAVGAAWGPAAGVASVLVLPPFAVATLHLRERWVEGRREVRRFVLKRTRGPVIAELRARQSRLAEEIASYFPALQER